MIPGQSSELTRRERIAFGLASVISETGYRESKMGDVAAAANVSLTTIYKEFANKEAILIELHEALMATLIGVVRAAVVFDSGWKDAIRVAFERYFGLMAEQPRVTYAVVIELATLSDAARESRERAMQELTDMLRDLVERGRSRYPEIESRSLSRPMARAVLGAVNELVVSSASGAERWPMHQLSETATDLLWGAVVV